MNLEQLKAYFTKVAGEWNGEDSGIKEDRAIEAEYGLNAIKLIEEVLKNLNA